MARTRSDQHSEARFTIQTPTAGSPSATFNDLLALMRMDRPVGTLLLLWPTLAALWAAADTVPPIELLIVFSLGTLFMRSAGCVANDIADRDFDGHVERTADRPLAAGRVTLTAAIALLAVLLLLSASLLLVLNPLSRWLSLAGLLLALTYPFFKRFTYFPQVPLGAAFSWGLILAFAAVRAEVPQHAWLLFFASLIWIVAYDTYYAMVDRNDDIKIGIKSTALLFGSADRTIILSLQGTALVAFALFGREAGYQGPYYLGLVVMGGLFAYQYRLTRMRDRTACFAAFKNNVWAGFALFAGTALEVSLVSA
ncbi:MAG: 4-hydroxybenzoate octaprenyltransferase [Pseudomonadota bacterium]